jgi:hypothetical protein
VEISQAASRTPNSFGFSVAFFERDKLTLVIHLHMLPFCHLPASYRYV